MSTPFKVLISGAGIAGPALALALLKTSPPLPVHITILERSPVPRTSGQAVDIRDAGVDVIKLLGIEPAIRAKTTTEEGIEFVYLDGERRVSIPMTGDTERQSFTSEYEILRGDLAGLLMQEVEGVDTGKGRVRWVFGECVREVQEEKDGRLRVGFANGKEQEGLFDLVVGADGMMSQTRRLVFGRGPEDNDFLKRMRSYWAFFTIPRIATDTRFSQWYITSRGRMLVTRPDQYGETRAYLNTTDWELARFKDIEKALKEGDREAQMRWLEKEYEHAGWQSERILKGMRTAPDFYMQELAQVKMEEFVKGRVALLGDAGYCPSPISGMGTTLAMVGAYILAGEIAKCPADIPTALERYQSKLKPFVAQCQWLFPGAPQMFFPQSDFGVRILDTLAGIICHPLLRSLGSAITWLLPRSVQGKKWKLPEYEAFR